MTATATRRPFRFGVQISESRTRTAWKEQARRAEALGYDILVMPDHLGGHFAIGPALAVVAEAATSLRIGTLVLQNDLHHPAFVVMEAATLDILSNGRFELGLGAGGSFLPDYEWTGIAFDPPGVRVGRLEESVPIIKGLFAPDPLTFSGQHYRIMELDGLPKPIQQPHPPILIGGDGPRMLTLAAREADIVSIFSRMLPSGGRFRDDEIKTSAVAEKVEFIRHAAGDRFPHLELNILVQVVAITEDRQAERERLGVKWGVPVDWLDSPYILVGTVKQIADELRAYREQLGLSYFVVFERDMDAFAPVVVELAGG